MLQNDTELELPLAVRRDGWFQQDGAPALNAVQWFETYNSIFSVG